MRGIFLILTMISVSLFPNFLADLLDLSAVADVPFSLPNSASGMIFQSRDFVSFQIHGDSISFFITKGVDFPLPLNTSILSPLCSRKGVDPSLMKAVMRMESSFRLHAISRSNAKGLMQIKTPTAFENGAFNSFDPFQNVSAGCEYLSKLIEKTGSIEGGLAAYFMGYRAFRERGYTSSSRRYVERVMKYMEYYRKKGVEEVIKDRMRFGVGFELKPNHYELHFLTAIPILGYLQLAGDVTLKKDGVFFTLNPSLYITDTISMGFKFDSSKSAPIFGVNLRSVDSRYSTNVSVGPRDGMNFSILWKDKNLLFGFRTGKNGIAFGGNMNIEDVHFGCGVNLRSFDSLELFFSIAFMYEI